MVKSTASIRLYHFECIIEQNNKNQLKEKTISLKNCFKIHLKQTKYIYIHIYREKMQKKKMMFSKFKK